MRDPIDGDLASEDRGAWTIVMTRPDGQTSIVNGGSHSLVQEEINSIGDLV